MTINVLTAYSHGRFNIFYLLLEFRLIRLNRRIILRCGIIPLIVMALCHASIGLVFSITTVELAELVGLLTVGVVLLWRLIVRIVDVRLTILIPVIIGCWLLIAGETVSLFDTSDLCGGPLKAWTEVVYGKFGDLSIVALLILVGSLGEFADDDDAHSFISGLKNVRGEVSPCDASHVHGSHVLHLSCLTVPLAFGGCDGEGDANIVRFELFRVLGEVAADG